MTGEQERMFALLCRFKQICEEYHLSYYLSGGTLLGAVRHHGFIPWDDDVDVSMPVEDFLRFQDVAESLPKPLALQTRKTDPRYPFVFAKLCDTSCPLHTGNASEPMGVYIDIFPLIPAKEARMQVCLYFNVIQIINYVLQVKLQWTKFIPYKQLKARAGFWLLRLLPVSQLEKLRIRIIGWIYDPDSRKTICSPGGAYKADKELYPAEWFKSITEMTFEGEHFAVPVGWHECLRRNYGDYMTLPPEEERRSHHK